LNRRVKGNWKLSRAYHKVRNVGWIALDSSGKR
jgi:hypothetical protein